MVICSPLVHHPFNTSYHRVRRVAKFDSFQQLVNAHWSYILVTQFSSQVTHFTWSNKITSYQLPTIYFSTHAKYKLCCFLTMCLKLLWMWQSCNQSNSEISVPSKILIVTGANSHNKNSAFMQWTTLANLEQSPEIRWTLKYNMHLKIRAHLTTMSRTAFAADMPLKLQSTVTPFTPR